MNSHSVAAILPRVLVFSSFNCVTLRMTETPDPSQEKKRLDEERRRRKAEEAAAAAEEAKRAQQQQKQANLNTTYDAGEGT